MATDDGRREIIYVSPKQSALLIYGYTRINFTVIVCPEDIIQLCLKWYLINKDWWDLDKTSPNIKVTDDIAEMKKPFSLFTFSTVVGSIIISKTTAVMEWKLKLISKGGMFSRFCTVIGIVPCNSKFVDNTKRLLNTGYGMNLWNGSINDERMDLWDRKTIEMNPQEMDVITIKYISINSDTESDSIYGELYFGINDMELVKIIDSIPINNDEKYRFAVSLQNEREIVQLLQ